MATQPNNFGFGENEAMLKDSAAKFFADNCSPDKIHSLVAGDFAIHRPIQSHWDKSLWQQITELGWTAACVPESAGGLGMPLVAAIGVIEEAGRVAFPSPLISTYITTFVLNHCHSEAATAALGRIAGGTPASLAWTNSKGSWEVTDTDVEVNAGTLNGAVYYVQDAAKADFFVVSARGPNGVGLYLVEANSQGVELLPDGIIDLTRDQAHLQFTDVDAIELCAQGEGHNALGSALPAILSLVCADMVGSSEWLLQTTVDYTSTRIQFDRPLAFFQAVKHPLVNVMLDIDQARSLTYNAACAYDTEPEEAPRLARMAKSAASEVAVFSSSRAVQFHGGIGFTWECFVHLFFKRQMHNQMLYGDGKYQRTKLADMLIGKAA